MDNLLRQANDIIVP